jgi:hypothetical protein
LVLLGRPEGIGNGHELADGVADGDTGDELLFPAEADAEGDAEADIEKKSEAEPEADPEKDAEPEADADAEVDMTDEGANEDTPDIGTDDELAGGRDEADIPDADDRAEMPGEAEVMGAELEILDADIEETILEEDGGTDEILDGEIEGFATELAGGLPDITGLDGAAVVGFVVGFVVVGFPGGY